jgi:rhamnose transport system substrate-binding protein
MTHPNRLSGTATTASEKVDWLKLIAAPERILAVLLTFEIVVFSILGTNFFTRDNAFEVVRFSVEIGLLALALTPVIVSGGIDLSVGSLMGLSAVLFGKLWRDAGLPIWLAASITIGCGILAGGLNALLITRFKIPPLIVTLGSYSLFRGLAEGMTAAVENFTDFPASFLFLGQGYLLWGIPVTRGSPCRNGLLWCMSYQDWLPASRPSFMWPTWGKRKRMPGQATN